MPDHYEEFNAEDFYKNYNQREQDEKDLRSNQERRAESQRQKAEYIKNEEQKISVQIFDCRFKDQPSRQRYQLPIERITNEPQTINSNIGPALVETIFLNHDTEFDIEGFLDYQHSVSKVAEKRFTDSLEIHLQFGLKLMNGSGHIPDDIRGNRVKKWIGKTRNRIENAGDLKTDEISMSRRACSLAYFYMQTREGYLQMTKHTAERICKDLGFKYSPLAIRSEVYRYSDKNRRYSATGNTKSDTSLIKDFGLCIRYLGKYNHTIAKSVAELELNILLSAMK